MHCECQENWFGQTCTDNLYFDVNLIKNDFFLDILYETRTSWFKFRDGCEEWTAEGIKIKAVNENSMMCGIGQIVQLNQSEPRPLLIFAQSKSIDIVESDRVNGNYG